jgi:hypothetical protein
VQDLLDGVVEDACRVDNGLQTVGQQVLLSVPVPQVALGDVLKVLDIGFRRVPQQRRKASCTPTATAR